MDTVVEQGNSASPREERRRSDLRVFDRRAKQNPLDLLGSGKGKIQSAEEKKAEANSRRLAKVTTFVLWCAIFYSCYFWWHKIQEISKPPVKYEKPLEPLDSPFANQVMNEQQIAAVARVLGYVPEAPPAVIPPFKLLGFELKGIIGEGHGGGTIIYTLKNGPQLIAKVGADLNEKFVLKSAKGKTVEILEVGSGQIFEETMSDLAMKPVDGVLGGPIQPLAPQIANGFKTSGSEGDFIARRFDGFEKFGELKDVTVR